MQAGLPSSQQQPPAVVARRLVQYVEEVQVAAAARRPPVELGVAGRWREPEHGDLEPQPGNLEAPPEEEDEVRGGNPAASMSAACVTSPQRMTHHTCQRHNTMAYTLLMSRFS